MRGRAALLVLAVSAAPAAAQVLGRAPAQPAAAAAAPAAATPAWLQAPTDTAAPRPQVIGWLRPGQTRHGNLETNDFRMGDGTWADVWYFEGTAGQAVDITVSSRAFLAYVQLLDPSGNKLAESPNNKASDYHVTYHLTAPGRYQVVVNCLGSDLKTGPYTVALSGPSR